MWPAVYHLKFNISDYIIVNWEKNVSLQMYQCMKNKHSSWGPLELSVCVNLKTSLCLRGPVSSLDQWDETGPCLRGLL